MEKCIECGGNLISAVGNGKMVCQDCGLESESLIFDFKPVFVEPIKPKKTVFCKEFTPIQKRLNSCYNKNDELIKKQICSYISLFKIEPKTISENICKILKLYKKLDYKIHTKNNKIILASSEFLLSRNILFDFDSIKKQYDGNLSTDLLRYFGRKTLFPKARWLIRNAELDEQIKSTAEKLLYKTKNKINFSSAAIGAIVLTAIAIEKHGISMSAKELYKRFGSRQCVLTSHKILYQTLREKLLKR